MKPETFDMAAEREDILQIRLDLRSIGFDYRRYIWIFVPVFIMIFGLVFGYFATRPKLYTATSMVALDARNVVSQENQALIPIGEDYSAESIQINTELVLLHQLSLAERVVSALKLDQLPKVKPAPQSAKESAKSQAPVETLSPQAQQARLRRNIAGSLYSGLKIVRHGSTHVVYISYSAPNPALAADVANAWGQQYIAQKIDITQAELRDAGSGMAKRLEELRGEVLAREQAVASYKIANNLMTTGSATLTEGEISALNRQITDTKLTLAEKQARLSTARTQIKGLGLTADDSSPVNSPVLNTLRVRRAQLTRQVADLQSIYGPRHPNVIAAQGQVEDIDRQIRSEGHRIVANLQAQVDIEQRRLGGTQANLNSSMGDLANANAASVDLGQLEADAEAAQGVFEHYLSLYKQALTANPAQNVKARILSEAKAPATPSSPDLGLGFGLALAAASIGGAGAVLLRRMFETGIIVPGDIGYKLGQPHLATLVSVPAAAKDKAQPLALPDYVLQNPSSAFAEGLRALRAAILHMAPDHGGVIAITSPLPSEGKSTTSVCLAKIMAMSGQSVIVVECDLRRPGLSRALNRRAENGLLEVLSGDLSLEDVVLTDDTGIDYLLAPRKNRDVTGVFEAAIMDRLLTYLRHKYDIVILDTPPVLAIDETQILAAKADQTVMLVRWSKTPLKAVRAALDKLKQGSIIGIALTQMDERLFSKITMSDYRA
ncbi:GumC family protein [Asticcacaulis machinosus]|uniref:non-specific protein-tyrosine kinase n=1 Tax=Asticcacaulis machinosus TaxID=2984211 RepID=A0ABT5HJN4_9CAUL|nr:polysaccharide biosynthesis tyrosine autokinase [Asticcacaulis machinosus]MDC7676456.1 polysaccharide biosynthesis tyrosine autokinase [Asticcacaulis machinosus]